MDRRSWLWRRKSSEKSPGETESSGSLSSHSERFSDEQAYPTHGNQSQEVTSKAALADDEANESARTLTEKLSAALLSISAKEELVKQHAKVAEEAVSGWEKAENEVLVLKKQLEAATNRNSILEDRIGHLDGALKECLRQLRQTKEEQEQKIQEAVAKKAIEWELTKAELESKLSDVHVQFQAAKSEASSLTDSDLQPKLDAVMKENLALKAELLSRCQELEISIIERDLSTQTAENASKQHLESIKKVAKLEAECRRLRATVRRAFPTNDLKSFSASSVYVESFTDSQSDVGERLLAVESDLQKVSGSEPNNCEPRQSESWASALISELNHFKKDKSSPEKLVVSSVEIDLMDDFLEMERLAALPGTEAESCSREVGQVLGQQRTGEQQLKSELDAMINRTAELEEQLEKQEVEKVQLELALDQCQKQLEMSCSQLNEAEKKLTELETMLSVVQELKQAAEEKVMMTNEKIETMALQVRDAEEGRKNLLLSVKLLEEEVKRERNLSAEKMAKCRMLEDEISKMRIEADLQRETELHHAASSNDEPKVKQEQELAITACRYAECQRTIASLAQQLKSLATINDSLVNADTISDPTDEGLETSQDNAHRLNCPAVLVSGAGRF